VEWESEITLKRGLSVVCNRLFPSAAEMKFRSSAAAGAEFIPTRNSLLNGLRNWDDHVSWRRFFDTYWKLIYSVAIKSGLTDAEAQEVVQETVITVARHMPGFRYDPKVCSFKTWLMRVTHSRLLNQIRKEKRHAALSESASEEGMEDLLRELPDERRNELEKIWEEEWENNILDAAIERVKSTVPAEQFQLFDFNVLREWPASKVAEAFGVSSAAVHLAKHRVSRLIKREGKKIEREFA
jgi:RNA polymerase sigma factor (sigma-70 family)